MSAEVVVLNGTSSSGKTSIGRCLQGLLGRNWLLLGVDDLIRVMPWQDPRDPESTLAIASDGTVTVADEFRSVEDAWYKGLAAMARAGAGIIVDEVFLGGEKSQARLRAAMEGVRVVWVGVHCDPDVAEERERHRPDRVPGMARRQAETVHAGVVYDLVVDTADASPEECARAIASYVTS